MPGEGPGLWPGAACKARTANRIVKAEGCEASWHMTAKPTGTQPTVNAALVHRQFAHLPPGDLHRGRCAWMVQDPAWDHTGISRSRRCGELPAACDESAANTIDDTARAAVTSGVTMQKSAEVIVVDRCFTRAAGHEGPNMPSRVGRRAARHLTSKPDRASQVRRRLVLPTLCAFCAWSVRMRIELGMNRPLRTRTVGGVGDAG